MIIETNSDLQTIALGKKLGKLLSSGDVIALNGDLAGGKTTFTKGIGQALNIKTVINSPTFNILKIYYGDLTLYHIDAYRLNNSDYDLGFDEYIDEGIMVVEWPEFFKDYLPMEYLELNFNYIDDNSRTIEFIPHGKRFEDLIKELELC